MQNEELRNWLTLSFLNGLGPSLINRLVDFFGSPSRVLAAGSGLVTGVPGIGSRLARQFDDHQTLDEARLRAESELEKLAKSGGTLFCRNDALYPKLLRTIFDPPVVLYARGDITCLHRPSVAVIGSRAATTYGKRISFELSRELARSGVTIVSGMALGIDSEAHRGALAAGGATAGVLGCGLDVVYPRENESLYREVAAQGVLLSEYPLGTKPDAFRFPARNRIISGVVLGVVVVEATLKSGSLITARLALEQGREVFAVPGRVDSLKSTGTHKLLQQGAHLAHSAESILEELELALSLHHSAVPGETEDLLHGLDGQERLLLSCLEVYPKSIDEIVRASGLLPGEVHDLLLRLELKGLLRQVPGQQYERTIDADKAV